MICKYSKTMYIKHFDQCLFLNFKVPPPTLLYIHEIYKKKLKFGIGCAVSFLLFFRNLNPTWTGMTP